MRRRDHGLRARAFGRLEARVAEAVAGRDLVVRLVERGASEAAARFAQVDAARFETARGWWGRDASPTYAAEPHGGAAPARMPSMAGRTGRGGAPVRLLRRVDAERRPAPDVLRAVLEAPAADLRAVEFALDPWPRRILRPSPENP